MVYVYWNHRMFFILFSVIYYITHVCIWRVVFFIKVDSQLNKLHVGVITIEVMWFIFCSMATCHCQWIRGSFSHWLISVVKLKFSMFAFLRWVHTHTRATYVRLSSTQTCKYRHTYYEKFWMVMATKRYKRNVWSINNNYVLRRSIYVYVHYRAY